MSDVLPPPYVFPVGVSVRWPGGEGVVIEQVSAWLVDVRRPNGEQLITTTTDLELAPAVEHEQRSAPRYGPGPYIAAADK